MDDNKILLPLMPFTIPMLKHASVLLFLSIVSTVWSQEESRLELNGKITANVTELDGIYIVNRRTEKVSVTEKGGYFSILAKVGDTLMISSIQFKGKSIGLTQTDFEKELFFIRLESLIHPLDEVKIIKYNNINAVSLGIIPKGQKSYTPAERKYKTATDMSGGLGYVATLDPLINFLSGRTAMLKKEIEVEKKEFLLARLGDMFEEKYMIEKLNIPELYVKGFLYYIIENERFVSMVKSKNKTMSTFLLGELAVKYNDIIACESN